MHAHRRVSSPVPHGHTPPASNPSSPISSSSSPSLGFPPHLITMSLAEDHKFDADSDLYLGHPDSPRSKSACVGHSLPCLHGVVWYAQLSRCHAREMPTSGVTLSGSRSPIRRAVAWIRPRRPPRHAGQITLAAFFVSRRRSTRSPRHCLLDRLSV
ncbi:hypothetical protein OPV22_032362 [Ensete ventricosum]|uniref:Uncharacterized protein n=1 Tax=Ensete ventricosum TaxID=4639 RepID=A0AAV8PMF6_ENSVE|nr:hypothetical protein OPV22_032362 [Ensete ventricosum]